jgi:anti-sigma regulatory factor (Ser/Thr protein kinase)
MAASLGTAYGDKATEFLVSDSLSCGVAQQAARHLTLTLGFSETASEEIALTVAELGSNLVKYAGKGTLTLRLFEERERKGIEIESVDRGPGIPDVEKSFTDGYSTSGSLGYGLGTVNRLMDEVDIHSTPGSGTHVVCRRWLREKADIDPDARWDVGVFTRSRLFAAENGDAFVIKHHAGELLTGLIDGLGHGEFAQKAALAAQQYVQSHSSQPLEKIFAGVGRACKATRGVVMALARFKSSSRLQFASIGNIEVRTWSGEERIPFVLKRGFLGAQECHVHVQEFDWRPEWLLVLHTDGLRTHWQWSDFPGIQRDTAQVVASRLMRALAVEHDDATVLAVQGRRP